MSDRTVVEGWIQDATRQGWTVKGGRNGGHIQFYPPGRGAPISVSRTPDADDMKHQRSALMRAGLLMSNTRVRAGGAAPAPIQHEENTTAMREDSSPTVEVIAPKAPALSRGDLMEGALAQALARIDVLREEHIALRARVEELETLALAETDHTHPAFAGLADTQARIDRALDSLSRQQIGFENMLTNRINEIEKRLATVNPVEAFRASLQQPGR